MLLSIHPGYRVLLIKFIFCGHKEDNTILIKMIDGMLDLYTWFSEFVKICT